MTTKLLLLLPMRLEMPLLLNPRTCSVIAWSVIHHLTCYNFTQFLSQDKAAKDTCTKMATCKDPVCAHYYNDPDVERLCGICTMTVAGGGFGCFASDLEVVVEGRGPVPVGSVAVGECLLGADADGSMSFSRVYFIHDHVAAEQTVRLEHDNGDSSFLVPSGRAQS